MIHNGVLMYMSRTYDAAAYVDTKLSDSYNVLVLIQFRKSS